MTTPKQLTANRLNCLLSTGPRTAAGRAASRANAVRHGLLGKLPTLAALGETPEAWAGHCEAVLRDLGPVGPVQTTLAERVALLLWRMARSAKADAAAAAVAFRPAAALAAASTGPDVLDDDRLRDLRRRLADARDQAAAYDRAGELLDRLADAPGDEPVDPVAAGACWAAACRAAGLDPDGSGPGLALRVLEREGVSGSALALERRFQGWTAGRLRDGMGLLAAQSRVTTELTTAARRWLRVRTGELERAARDLEVAAAEAEGEQVAARVGPALEQTAAGRAALELIARYEGIQARELARALTLYFALCAARPDHVAGICHSEEVG